MNVRFRSNDAYKAAMMNIFALVQLQQRIAARIEELSGRAVRIGRYCHMADSYHVYGFNLREFEARFLGAIERRTFEQRTIRFDDVREIMEAARPQILQKARSMGRQAARLRRIVFTTEDTEGRQRGSWMTPAVPSASSVPSVVIQYSQVHHSWR